MYRIQDSLHRNMQLSSLSRNAESEGTNSLSNSAAAAAAVVAAHKKKSIKSSLGRFFSKKEKVTDSTLIFFLQSFYI